MSPFKRHDRKGGPYYIWPTLPGYGRAGPWSTGTRSKSMAQSIESFVQESWLKDPALIRGLIDRKYSLPALWTARQENRTDELKRRAKDPPLADVVERFRPLVTDIRIRQGLDQLLELAPDKARLSYLIQTSDDPSENLGPKNISHLCAAAIAAGRKPNSVRRSLYRAISDLLKHEIGKVRRNAILTNVTKPGEDDERDVQLAPEEIARLLEHADVQMRPLISIALLTGVDRGPLCRMEVRDFKPDRGTLAVPDTKTAARPRTLVLSEVACVILRPLVNDRQPHESLFGLTDGQVESRFVAIRKAAGLEHVRFKDLRGVFATNWEGSLKDLMQAMGHSNPKTTMRYIKRQLTAQKSQMDAVALRMGLGRHLRVSGGES